MSELFKNLIEKEYYVDDISIENIVILTKKDGSKFAVFNDMIGKNINDKTDFFCASKPNPDSP